MQNYPLYLAGKPVQTNSVLKVYNPSDGEMIYTVAQAEVEHAELAIEAARRGFLQSSKLPAWQRAEILTHIATRLQERKTEIAEIISAEAGKPISLALTEVDRAVQTFRLASAWVWTQTGETLDLSHAPGLEGRIGLVKYFPAGACLMISPFNFPLNLVAHKLAPAIATGNSFVLKPASATPRTALILAEIIAETPFPSEAWSVLPCSRQVGQYLVEHPGFSVLSFTGSPEVGWKMKADAGKKKVILELGGDAAVIVDETADLDTIVPKILFGAFAYAGQICISVQRIIATRPVYEILKNKLLGAIESVITGNAAESNVICGPVIDESNTRRTLQWIQEAVDAGAILLTGGEHIGHNLIRPAILENIPAGVHLREKEAFAPVVSLICAENFQDAVDQVNDSHFGLQTGVFTQLEQNLKYAFENLQVGGVIHNQVPTLRIDAMPYGGIKDSGLGREGVSYACKELCEPRILVW